MNTLTLQEVHKQESSMHAFGKEAEVNLRLHPDELLFPVPDINSGEASS